MSERRLVKGEKKIFGVCSGIANYFNCDPTIVRILFLVLLLGYGAGLWLYLIATIVMPNE